MALEALRGRGFIVITETPTQDCPWPREFVTVEEAQDEAARLYARTGRILKVILYAPMVVVSPKIDKGTEFKFTKWAAKLLPEHHPDRIKAEAEAEVKRLLAEDDGHDDTPTPEPPPAPPKGAPTS